MDVDDASSLLDEVDVFVLELELAACDCFAVCSLDRFFDDKAFMEFLMIFKFASLEVASFVLVEEADDELESVVDGPPERDRDLLGFAVLKILANSDMSLSPLLSLLDFLRLAL